MKKAALKEELSKRSGLFKVQVEDVMESFMDLVKKD